MSQRRILVTGASRGIGWAIFAMLAKQPEHYVVGTATTSAGADALNARIKAEGLNGEACALNVSINRKLRPALTSRLMPSLIMRASPKMV